MDRMKCVVVGNLKLNARLLREFLKKSCYTLVFDRETGNIALSVNHLVGGQDLLEIGNSSYENAARLAEELGLSGITDQPSCCIWHKWNPILRLHHDGSAEAEALRVEMLALGLPCIVTNGSELILITDEGMHRGSHWTPDQMFQIIRKIAARYRDQLNSLP